MKKLVLCVIAGIVMTMGFIDFIVFVGRSAQGAGFQGLWGSSWGWIIAIALVEVAIVLRPSFSRCRFLALFVMTLTTLTVSAQGVESPLIHYSFDNVDVTSTQVNDLTANGHHAAIVSSSSAPVAGVEGLFAEAFQFVGGDDPNGTVKIPTGIVPSGASERTISFWFLQEADLATDNRLFGYGSGTAGQVIDLGLEGGGLRLRHFGGYITYGSGGITADWHHVVLRVNADAVTFADVDVFLDGIQQVADGVTGQAINTSDSDFFIGRGGINTYANGFEGRMDEFKVWSSALSDADIQTLEAERPLILKITSFLSSAPNRVAAGTDVTLSWDAANFTSLTLNPGGIDVTATNSTVVTPSTTTTYTLTAENADGDSDSRTVTVVVGDQPFPNVLVFFLDDFGWADWEQNGADTGSVFYETPHMNRLASEGLYFDNGYASTPVCSPTRGALLSGQSPAYNKLTDWITGFGDSGQSIRNAEWIKKLELSNSIFPEVMAQYGYRAIHIGKWHLGHANPESNPLNHGFDVNIGGNQYGHPVSYFASSSGFSFIPNLGPDVAPAGSYLTDVLTEQAVDQIQQAASNDTPFVMYLSHYAVHTPLQAPAATIQKYQDKLDNNPGMDWQGQTDPTYAAMIEHVDLSLGAILDALDDPDGDPLTDDSIATNTLVVLTADNGGLIGSTSNRPLRNGKGGDYEGGIREPWIFRWPGTIAPGTNSEPIISHDLYPTVLSAAGLEVPQGHVVNGQDLTPLLTGGTFERQSPLVFHYPHWAPAYGCVLNVLQKEKAMSSF